MMSFVNFRELVKIECFWLSFRMIMNVIYDDIFMVDDRKGC